MKSFTKALNLLLLALAMAALLVPAMTHEAPELWPEDALEQWDGRPDAPANIPAWSPTLAEQFPACEQMLTLPDGAEVPIAALVVVDMHGDAQRMSWDETVARNTDDDHLGHDNPDANDVYVVGFCRR
jgi:hypothetical protein